MPRVCFADALPIWCTACGGNGSRAASGSLGIMQIVPFINLIVTFDTIKLPSEPEYVQTLKFYR